MPGLKEARIAHQKAMYDHVAKNISSAIVDLYSDQHLRDSLSNNVVLQSNKFVTSWNERIELEIGYINEII